MSGAPDTSADLDSGFTLIETLAALVCFASVFVAAQYCVTQGIRGARIADAEADALQVARSILQSVGAAIPMKDLEAGETKGVPWEIHVSKYDPQDPSGTAAKLDGYWVEAQVRWGATGLSERKLALKTLKLVPAP